MKFECTEELDSCVVKRVCYNATNVIMESNPHQLELADKPTFEHILAVPGSEFVGGNGRIYAERWGFGVDQEAFLIARSEDSTCNGEYCPTAFISLDGAKSKIIGLGWLPRRVLYGVSRLIFVEFAAGCMDCPSWILRTIGPPSQSVEIILSFLATRDD